jgi:pimeloyl-ACP methyl ester carboxylesterase
MKRAALSTVELTYDDRGAGKPVLLIHGFPLNRSMWAAQIDALAGSFRIIAPDLRGYGVSTLGDADARQGISMERYADDLAELLNAINVREPVTLVGFSMGGYIAWQFVRKYAARVRALVQCDTKAAADTEEARQNRLKMAESIHEWGSARVADTLSPKFFSRRTQESKPEIVAAVRRMIESAPPDAIAAAQRGMAARPDVTSLLPQITVPTLLIGGAEDVISPPEEMRSIAAAMPSARYVEIADAGHMAPMENSDAVNAALLQFIVKER